MKKIQKLTLFLAIVMLITAAFTGCMKQEEEERKIWWELGEEGRAATPDNLPEDLNYDGYEFTIYHRGAGNDEADGYDGDGADPVHVVVYERNRKIEHRLNCKFNWVPSSTGKLSETAQEITKILNTNQYFDFFLTTNNTIVVNGKNPYLCDLADTRYIDFTQPWYWEDVMEEVAFDGSTINFLVGDLNVSNIKKLSAMYFNTNLIKSQLNMNSADFYKMVDDKTWTIEKFYALTKQCYKDTDKNPMYSGQKDQQDIFGFAWSGAETINQFAYSTIVAEELYERLDIRVVITMENNTNLQELCEQLTEMVWNNEGAWDRRSFQSGVSYFDSDIVKEFSQNNYVFLAYRLGGACTAVLRGMSNFGIIPYPTLYAGDDYISHIDSSATSVSIPIVVKTKDHKQLDRASAVIEALYAESYRHTIDAFYKDALQTRYTRDPDSVRMIDIIYESAHKSFLVEYAGKAGSITSKIFSAVEQQKNIEGLIAGSLASSQSAINGYINEVLESYRTT